MYIIVVNVSVTGFNEARAHVVLLTMYYREKTKQAALAKNSAARMTYMTSTKACITGRRQSKLL